MKMFAMLLFISLVVYSPLVAGDVENKAAAGYKPKIKKVSDQIIDVSKGVSALDQEFKKLNKQVADLKKQQKALSEQIVSAQNSLNAVGTLFGQIKQSALDTSKAVQISLAAVKTSPSTTAESVQATALSKEIGDMMKHATENLDGTEKALNEVRKTALGTTL